MKRKERVFGGYVYGGLIVVALYVFIVGWTVFSVLTSPCCWWSKLLSLALAVEVGIGCTIVGLLVGSWMEFNRR